LEDVAIGLRHFLAELELHLEIEPAGKVGAAVDGAASRAELDRIAERNERNLVPLGIDELHAPSLGILPQHTRAAHQRLGQLDRVQARRGLVREVEAFEIVHGMLADQIEVVTRHVRSCIDSVSSCGSARPFPRPASETCTASPHPNAFISGFVPLGGGRPLKLLRELALPLYRKPPSVIRYRAGHMNTEGDAVAQTHPFQAEVAELLRLMVNAVYSEADVFLRELISNASDACDRLRYEAIAKPELLAAGGALAIRITPDAKA